MSITIDRIPISPNDVGQVSRTIWDTGSTVSEMDHGNAGLKIGNSSSMNDYDIRESGYIIFPNIDIPAGSVIHTARLKYQGSVIGNEPVLSTIYFNDVADAVPLTSVAEFDAASLTSGISWNTTEDVPTGEDRWTNSLVSILQPIIDKAAWESGNSVMMIVKENSNDVSLYRYIDGYKSEAAGFSGTTLEIEYTPPFYEGVISERVQLRDQIATEEGTNVNASVLGQFNTPFSYSMPEGYIPFAYGFMPMTWDDDERGSEVQKTGLYGFPYDDKALYTTVAPSIGYSDSDLGSCIATTGKSTGKWYWEIKVGTHGGRFGNPTPDYPPVPEDVSVGIATSNIDSEVKLGTGSLDYAYCRDGNIVNNGFSESLGDRYGDRDSNDVVGVALDLDNHKIWFSLNGVWQGGGSPAAGTFAAATIPQMTYFPAGTSAGYGWYTASWDGIRYTDFRNAMINGVLFLRVDADDLEHDVPAGFFAYASDPQIVEGEISEGFSTADDNAVNVLYNEGPTDHEGTPEEDFTMSDLVYGELPGDTEDPTSLTSADSFTMDDSIVATGTSRAVEERFATADVIEATAPQRSISEGVSTSDAISANVDPWNATVSEDVESSDSIVSPIYGDESEDVTTADVAVVVFERPGATSEGVTTADEISASKEKGDAVTEILQAYETIGWTWIKSLVSTAEITETVSIEVTIPVTDVLTAKDEVSSKWAGTEAVESTLGMFGSAVIAQIFNEAVTSTADAVDAVTYLHRMISAVTSSLEATDAVLSKAIFNPVVAESVAITGLLSVLHTLNETVSESAAIADAIGFGWLESIEDSGVIVDAAAVRLLAIHILTSNLVATDTAVGLFNFTDSLTDTLGIAATVAVKQILQEHITDILHFGIVVELDGELWECWVLNTNAFHASVYSGFSFNSYAVHNNTAYGCKNDGIYKLSGDTDDGNEFKAGVVLPESRFGTHNFKRFRKAYFGMSGSAPAIKMVNEDGTSNTYTISNSKVTPTRGVKGRRWTLSVEGFDSLDFVELAPIMLTR